MAKLRSVFPDNFKYVAIPLILSIATCASPAKRGRELAENISSRSILSLRPIKTIGPIIDEKRSLVEPAAISINRIGEIFISDRATNSIYKLSDEFNSISSEGGIGAELGGFNSPVGIASDAALNLYIADSGNRRIQVLDRNLHFVKSVDSYFDENNQPLRFNRPEDVTIDSESSFWIADNDMVIRLSPFYELQLELSYRVPGNFRIGRVSSVDVSKSGYVAIGDQGNRQVIIVSIHGNPISEFSTGSTSSVAWDDHDIIWVTDPEAGKLSAYDLNGVLLFVYSEGTSGYRPRWLAFDSAGRLLVLDAGLRRLTMYEVIRGIGD
ncbi:MAG: NHL repeat-containing protein [candidate division Zixibacteria bacterium]